MPTRSLETTFLSLIAAGGLVLAGCGDDDGDNPGTPDGSVNEPTAQLRVVHSSPDAPAVDIYAEGLADPLFEDVEYGEATEYLTIPAGTYNIQLRGAGAASDTAPVFETGDLDVPADATITAVAAGLFGSTNAADRFRVLPLAEGFDAPASGNAIVRIVHASPDAPTVAIDVGNDGSPEVPDFARFTDTGAAGVELPAGEAIQIGIWAGDPLARVTAFTTPELPAGAELFVIATGLVDRRPYVDDAFGLLAVGPDGAIGIIEQNPVVYALHASPDAPAVDICAGSTALAENLSYTELSGKVQVPPGDYGLDFYAYDAGTAPCTGTPANGSTPIQTGALAAGTLTMAIAAGELAPEGDEEPFGLIAVPVTWDPAGDQGTVTVVHASGDAPSPVDVGTLTGGQIVDPAQFADVAYGEASSAQDLPAATYLLGVGAAGAAPAATFNVPVSSGAEVFAVAAGAFAPDAGEAAFGLIVVDTLAWGEPALLEAN